MKTLVVAIRATAPPYSSITIGTRKPCVDCQFLHLVLEISGQKLREIFVQVLHRWMADTLLLAERMQGHSVKAKVSLATMPTGVYNFRAAKIQNEKSVANLFLTFFAFSTCFFNYSSYRFANSEYIPTFATNHVSPPVSRGHSSLLIRRSGTPKPLICLLTDITLNQYQ